MTNVQRARHLSRRLRAAIRRGIITRHVCKRLLGSLQRARRGPAIDLEFWLAEYGHWASHNCGARA